MERTLETIDIPAHVPRDRVRDFDIFSFVEPTDDVHVAWHDVINNGPPLFYTPHFGGYWVIANGALLDQVFADAEGFISGEGVGIPVAPPEIPKFLPIDADGPFHKALRRPLNVALSPKAVQALSVSVRELAIELIEGIAPNGRCDFVTDFSLKLPMELFLRIVDMPSNDREYLLGVTHSAIKGKTANERFAAFGEMNQYLDAKVRERMANPGDDLMSAIITLTIDGEPLTHQQQIGYMTTVMLGGLDTVGGMMAMTARHLANYPADRRRLIEHPEVLNEALEEILRRYGISTVSRYVTRDIDLDGVTVKAGDRIILPSMVHGLDESEWPDALKVDFDRQPRGYLTFGKGVHRCPGANLARAELRIFVEEWLKRIPDFAIDPEGQVLMETSSVMGLKSLPLVWTV